LLSEVGSGENSEKEFWGARDPIKKFASYLLGKNIVSSDELIAIEQRVQSLINEAVEFAQNSPEPDPKDLHRYIFAED
jgi:pyruvate dehydrogenase E1 component alpha subunit